VISASSTGQRLNTASAYTALSLISLLSSPMNALVEALPNLNAAMACFARIGSFLGSDVRRDHRLPLLSLDELTTVSTSGLSESTNDISIEMSRLASGKSQPSVSTAMIDVRGASFSWTVGDNPVVRNLTFKIQQGQFCFLVGPVGSGKSTLLKGLLGETPSSQGFVYSNTSAIAFVDQTPWVRNGTIQENILGISAFDEQWYNLMADIAILPRGHGMFPLGYDINHMKNSTVLFLTQDSNTSGKCWNLSQWRSKATFSTCQSSLREENTYYFGRRVFWA